MPVVHDVTCLGCGCACDDIDLLVDGNRIVEARHACDLGVAWFGDGVVPARARVGTNDVSPDDALNEAARLLTRGLRPLVYLAPGLSCEAQREGVALADALRATLDSVTSATIMRSVLSQQERGRAGATLGEVRNRADVLVFWGIDPSSRYPRYRTRYAPEPAGVHVPEGRRSRTIVAVDIGDARGPSDADVRVSVSASAEVAVLTALRAAISNPDTDRINGLSRPVSGSDPGDESYRGLTPILLAGKYVVIVADAEPDGAKSARDAGWADALIALTLALNGPTRCALSSLRAGGNRSGADAVATWQTGYPAAISFARGYPQYRPYDTNDLLQAGAFDAVLVLGQLSSVPDATRAALERLPGAIVGPKASEAAPRHAAVAIDTGMAGIHEAGTAIRMDDVPLPMRVAISGPPTAAAMARALLDRVVRSRTTNATYTYTYT